MRVLFVDFDGVLNSQPWLGNSEDLRREACIGKSLLCPLPKHETDRERDLSHLNPENIGRLNTILDQTGCYIVVSSTWRLDHSLEELTELLVARGLKFPEKMLDMTEREHDTRGKQIHRWLLAHWDDIEGMCILDDDSDMDPYMPWLVKTNFFAGGLRDKHVQFAVNLLMEKFEPAFKIQSPRTFRFEKDDSRDLRGSIVSLLCSSEISKLSAEEHSWLETLVVEHNDRYLSAAEEMKLSDLSARLLGIDHLK